MLLVFFFVFFVRLCTFCVVELCLNSQVISLDVNLGESWLFLFHNHLGGGGAKIFKWELDK